MFSLIKSLIRQKQDAYVKFIPLCHVPPREAGMWHQCPPLILSNEAYERLYEFLQANLDGHWSVLPQDRNHLDQYDVLLEAEVEAGLIDLFKVTMGMAGCQMAA